MLDTSPPLPRYNGFNVHSTTYKSVRGHPLELSVLIPKKISPGTYPLLVRFHGGGLVEGVRLGDWFRPYILDHCVANPAIVISPDYRLLPEATGWDILDDLRDFWHWVADDLGRELAVMQDGIQVKLDKVAVSGESAGGYLAAQSFLVQGSLPKSVRIRAALLQAPMLDLDPLTKPAPQAIFDFSLFPETRPADLYAASPPGTVVSSHEPGPGLRLEAAISMFQHGTWVDALQGRYQAALAGESERKSDILWPVRNLEAIRSAQGDNALMPALWVVTGWHDCMVAPEATVRFCTAYKRATQKAEVLIDICDGDHGFDGDWTSDTSEVKRGWDFVRRHWALNS